MKWQETTAGNREILVLAMVLGLIVHTPNALFRVQQQQEEASTDSQYLCNIHVTRLWTK